MTARRERGSLRLVAVFAVTVLIPALALAVLAWGGVEKERRALRAERDGALGRACGLIHDEIEERLAELRREEQERPYYHYSPLFVDPNSIGFGRNYVASPIADRPPDPLIEGYYRIDPQGDVETPNDPRVLARVNRAPPRQEKLPAGAPDEARPPREEHPPFEVSQTGRTQRAMDSAESNVLPRVKESGAQHRDARKGEFPGVAAENLRQWVPRAGLAANSDVPRRIAEILDGAGSARQTPEDFENDRQGDEAAQELLEVVVSPLLFEPEPGGGVLAYRYVDVPNETGTLDGRPFLRYVQGFRLDTDYLRGTLFPQVVAKFLDVPGAAARVLDGEEPAPEGNVAARASLASLPGWRVVVLDEDPDWVSRRVARLSAAMLVAAGGLLLVILGGLHFTVRAVRSELSLARRKSDFVAAVTHELRTPLTGIRMYADLLKEGWVKDEATRSEYVAFMAGETDRLTRLVNRVLDFARSEKGRLEVAPLDLAKTVRDAEPALTAFLAERGFALAVEAAGECAAAADADAVTQILWNLLENAAKYAAEAKERTVTVRAAVEGAAKVLSVEDHGPGVPPAERERIFDDFYRPGAELTREKPGAGIGLALVRRLADAMGARVEVRETPGGGATFRVVFR